MKIVVVQETDWQKRGPHQQHHLFERLSLRGHEVTVLDYPILREHWPNEPLFVSDQRIENAARIYPDAAIRLIQPGTISFGPAARPSSVASHWRVLRRLIREASPDLIISYALSTGVPALQLARQYKIPYVFHVIDALHAIVPANILRPVALAVEKTLLRSADEVVLINEHLREYAVSLGADPSNTCVLRTGVDLERFGGDEDRETVRQELGLAESDLVLFFMGWLYDFSGVREVALSLKAMPSHIKLLVVGDGDQYDELCQIRDEQLGERLILTGRVPYQSIRRLIQAADVCLLPFEKVPATEHIVPIKLYEYMASNRPVIAAPLPGVLRDIGEANGVIYAEAGEQAKTALESVERYRERAALSRRFVEASCDWNTITDHFEDLLLAHGGASAK